jgi:hypothetical protein
MTSNRSTLVLLPAGGSNFTVDETQTVGPLGGELPRRIMWERQTLVEQAATLGWEFVHQHQLVPPGIGIVLSFERL